MAKLTDEYTATAVFSLAESGANTLTYEGIQTGLSIYDHIGWVIGRVEWRLGPTTMALFNASGDYLTAALTMSNNLTALVDTDPQVICIRRWDRLDFGTAASGSITPNLLADDYTGLPGGGLLVLPNPIWGAIVGNGLTGAAGCTIKIFFRPIPLKDADYFNLVQARQLLVSQ